MTAASDNGLLIGGAGSDGTDSAAIDAYKPTTGEAIAQVPNGKTGKAVDVDQAAVTVQKTSESAEWSGLSSAARARLLCKAGDVIDANADELAKLTRANHYRSPAT